MEENTMDARTCSSHYAALYMCGSALPVNERFIANVFTAHDEK